MFQLVFFAVGLKLEYKENKDHLRKIKLFYFLITLFLPVLNKAYIKVSMKVFTKVVRFLSKDYQSKSVFGFTNLVGNYIYLAYVLASVVYFSKNTDLDKDSVDYLVIIPKILIPLVWTQIQAAVLWEVFNLSMVGNWVKLFFLNQRLGK